MSAPFTPDYQLTTDTGGYKYSIDYRTIRMNVNWDAQSLSCTVYAMIPADEPSHMGFVEAMMGESHMGNELELSWNGIDNETEGFLYRSVPERLKIRSTDPDEYVKYYCTQCSLTGIYENGVTSASEEDVPYRDGRFLKPQPDPISGFWPRGRFAKYECTFSSLAYDVLTDEEIDTAPEWSTELTEGVPSGGVNESLRYCIFDETIHEENERSLPGEICLDVGGRAIPLGEVPFQRSGYRRLRVQWLQLPELPPEANVIACMSKVNATTITIGRFTYPPEKVLVTSFETKSKTDTFGHRHYERTYIMNIRTDERTWNQFRRPDNGTLAEAKLKIGGTYLAPTFGDKLYKPVDLSKLFKFI